jgi:hypothetical protein
MSETFTFKVDTGWLPRRTHNTDLILTPDRVRLGDRELPATEVDWIRIEISSTVYQGKSMGNRRVMELGNSSTSLWFILRDWGSATTHTDAFPQLLSAVMRFYGTKIVQQMIDTLAGGGSFNIGKLRFAPSFVEIPKKKYLVVSDQPVAVPWARIMDNINNSGWGRPAFVADKESHHVPSVLGLMTQTDNSFSTSYSETFWTPNACLIESLVHFMHGHPEISGGPWYVARNKKKVGPFFWPQLKQMASGELVQPADMLIQEGAEKWSAAATVPGLFPAAVGGEGTL